MAGDCPPAKNQYLKQFKIFPMARLIFDAHLDLSMNALEWNRDFTRPVSEIREREKQMKDKPDRGNGTVSLPALRQGRIGLCVATQIARYVPAGGKLQGWFSQEQAWAQTQGQLAWYQAMEEKGEMVQIRDSIGLERQTRQWLEAGETGTLPVGYLLSLEGADSLVNLHYLEKAYNYGLRAVGPAHYGPGVYAHGTDSEGGLGIKGRELIREMERLNIILDATHLSDESFREALQLFRGRVWASHNNCRALVPHQRQFSDDQIRALIERGAVIGAAFDAWMLVPGWTRGHSTPASTGLTLSQVCDHMDHVCQLAGNSRHAALGTDLDGAFGKEQCPLDLETIADLQLLEPLLKGRGYSENDLENIFYRNWVGFLTETWKTVV